VKRQPRNLTALSARRAARKGTLEALKDGRKIRATVFTPKTYYSRKAKHTKGATHE